MPVVVQEIAEVQVMERIQEQSAVSDLVTSVESSQVVDSVPLLHAMEVHHACTWSCRTLCVGISSERYSRKTDGSRSRRPGAQA